MSVRATLETVPNEALGLVVAWILREIVGWFRRSKGR